MTRTRDFGTGSPVEEMGYKDVYLRTNLFNVAKGLAKLKQENEEFLAPWSASPDLGVENYSFNIYNKEEIVGQVLLYNFARPKYGDNICSVSYWVGEKHTRQGIGSTAVELACQYAFGPLDIDQVEAPIQPHNFPSIRLALRVGFELKRRVEGYMPVAGKMADHDIYTLFRDGYESNLR